MRRARLVMNPEAATPAPPSPGMLLEIEGKVIYYQGGWPRLIKEGRLEETTVADLCEPLHLRPSDRVHLSAVRELPDLDLMSSEFLHWARDWWKEAVAELAQELVGAAS